MTNDDCCRRNRNKYIYLVQNKLSIRSDVIFSIVSRLVQCNKKKIKGNRPAYLLSTVQLLYKINFHSGEWEKTELF